MKHSVDMIGSLNVSFNLGAYRGRGWWGGVAQDQVGHEWAMVTYLETCGSMSMKRITSSFASILSKLIDRPAASTTLVSTPVPAAVDRRGRGQRRAWTTGAQPGRDSPAGSSMQ